MSKNKIKFLAYYLPQYHQIPENDEWWGKGFTEWTNVKKAKPLFKGHQQPIEPGELGYYDLLHTPNIQKDQAKLAKEYGLDGFIYYQYWFGNGKMLLEKPAENMLKDRSIDMPFCFCWANETWKGIWHGLDNPDTLIEQTYPGEEDYINYFNYLLPFFKDERYIRVDDKPLFVIYDSLELPAEFIKLFRHLAIQNNLKGIYFMASNRGSNTIDYRTKGFDAKISGDYNVLLDTEINKARKVNLLDKLLRKVYLKKRNPIKLFYGKFFRKLQYSTANVDTFPMVLPNWDNTPRSKLKGFLFANSSPEFFKLEIDKATQFLTKHEYTDKFIIIKSWNEWAEGNYIEPDQFNANKWLEALK
ncbi:glycoside hydrolase family 99-like domain-containing protein [Kaistella sp. G5-32]|uniref:Glycoside hydrolase family 99-like domain-containing protein n=1 Tax=Kaistella gelatinilytica TaxID=2787636 RepID=A0ABS0FC30_9FLAO|nr:glycoside hydrolase family 99-like domain-containing protein [Kaistella gelatinilytica]MBF8457264.1 glycoside hydrolase family 99-like domain-containing protein [Kaistella gelatinilytica]